MTDALLVTVALAYGYLVGSIPTAYLVARLKKGIDIRQYGSGNVGASNVARHLGKGYFAPVVAFDVLVKGAASVGLARVLGLALEYQALAALLAVMGHNWSVYLRFSGGRGIAVGVGGLLVLSWKALLALLVIFFLGWIIFRSTALWFGIAFAVLPLGAVVLGEPATVVIFCIALLAVSALKRLLSNPGAAPPGLRWRDMAISRLLYDRDTPGAKDWVWRTPEETHAEDEQ